MSRVSKPEKEFEQKSEILTVLLETEAVAGAGFEDFDMSKEGVITGGHKDHFIGPATLVIKSNCDSEKFLNKFSNRS